MKDRPCAVVLLTRNDDGAEVVTVLPVTHTPPSPSQSALAIEVPGNASELQARFLGNDTPIVGRIMEDRFTIELRTLLPDDEPLVAAALRDL